MGDDSVNRARVRRVWLTLVVGLSFVLAACAENAPQDTLKPASPDTRSIDDLFWLTFWVATGVFVLVEGLLLFAIIRHRDKGEPGEPVQTHGNVRLEAGWAIVPGLILLFLAFPTVGTILKLARDKPDALKITVTGHQFWWEYRYAGLGVVAANELHLPVNRNVELSLRSNDVIHSFWVPRLFGKHDVEPGRVAKINMSAETPGEYLGQCVEFCGLSHANMRLKAIVHTEEGFNEWLAAQRRPPATPAAGSDAEGGLNLFQSKGCSGCHTVSGISTGTLGPDLSHVDSRTTFAGSMLDMNAGNLRRWLKDPPKVKPGSKMPNLNLSDEEITQLIAYLETLK